MDLAVSSRSDGVAILTVGGDVDIESAPALAERIAAIIEDGQRRLVVDLCGVDFIDSTGLGALVGGLNQARSVGGRLDLVCNLERVNKLLRITGLNDVFTIYTSLDDLPD